MYKRQVFDYLEGREFAPKGETWSKAVEFWKTLKSDEEALFDKEVEIDITGLELSVSYTHLFQQSHFYGSWFDC